MGATEVVTKAGAEVEVVIGAIEDVPPFTSELTPLTFVLIPLENVIERPGS